MSFRNILSEHLTLRISDIVANQSIHKDLQFLLKSQWWSRSDMKEFQREQLMNLISHAYEYVPYYRQVFKDLKLTPEDIKSEDDLKKLPLLTKQIIRENFKNGRLLSRKYAPKDRVLTSSSGSTGEPLQYYTTGKSYSMRTASALRGWYWMGYRLGDKYVKLSQNPRQGLKSVQDTLNRCTLLPTRIMNRATIKDILDKINRARPTIIRGYPDTMLFLAKYLSSENFEIHIPRAIATTGNVLFDDSRSLIEKQFSAKVFDSYSCEGTLNISECSSHECYHPSMESGIMELITDSPEGLNSGSGRLISTDLTNLAMPFIRYDTQDYITQSEINCTCGRGFDTIGRINGRDSDILVTELGQYLIVHNFTAYFTKYPAIEQFQVRQDSHTVFRFILKTTEDFTLEMSAEIIQDMKEMIGGNNIKIEINTVNDIPLTDSGKRRFLIRNPEIPLFG